MGPHTGVIFGSICGSVQKPAWAPQGPPAGQGTHRLTFPDWLNLRHILADPDGRLPPEAHREQRARYLRELGEARRGGAHFHLGTGEGERDDWEWYLEWEPGPHWDRGLWPMWIGTAAALRIRVNLRDSQGR